MVRAPPRGTGARGSHVPRRAAVDAFLLAEERGFPEHLCREAGLAPWQAKQVVGSRDRLLAGRGRGGTARDSALLGRCLLAGFPDRVAARAAEGEPRTATMAGGRGLVLPAAADGQQYVVALRLLETGRQSRSRATLTAEVTTEDLGAVFPGALATVVAAELDESAGRVVAVRQNRYRDLPLSSARGGELPDGAAAELLLPLLAREPWRWLGEQKELRRLLARMRWLTARSPDLGLPSWDDTAVARSALDLLAGRSDLRALRDAEVAELLMAQLSGPQRRALQQGAPDRIELPSGRAAVVDYDAPAGPTIAARLQEFFGLRAVGALAGGRVPVVLELLGPNHQPVQVTTDLPSFWANVYPQVRRELSRRYPRHSWPEDPLAATPEARPARRRRG
ncbi:MAG: ATP-dependent helicase C-terminal domain-containing protein [Planctomycetota bacterium]